MNTQNSMEEFLEHNFIEDDDEDDRANFQALPPSAMYPAAQQNIPATNNSSNQQESTNKSKKRRAKSPAGDSEPAPYGYGTDGYVSGSRQPNAKDINAMKRRFVWPPSLHQDFIGAVFDIGLRYATSRDVLAMINANLPPSHGPSSLPSNAANHELMKSQILKFQLFRDKRYQPRAYFYDAELLDGPASSLSPSTSSLQLSAEDQLLLLAAGQYAPSSAPAPAAASSRPTPVRQRLAAQFGQSAATTALPPGSGAAEQQRVAERLEKECRELLRTIHNQLIKTDFLVKLEADMTQELAELIGRQAEKRQILATNLRAVFEAFPGPASAQSQPASPLAAAMESVRSHLSLGQLADALGLPASLSLPLALNPNNPSSSNGLGQSQPLAERKEEPAPASASMAELLEAKYKSIMEMKDHIKLHRLLLNKQLSQIHGSPSDSSQAQTFAAVVPAPPPSLPALPPQAATKDPPRLSEPSATLPVPAPSPFALGQDLPAASHGPGHGHGRSNTETSQELSRWLDDFSTEEDLFSFLLDP
jgi:hypothetical protein